MQTDMVIAAKGARFGQPEINLGIMLCTSDDGSRPATILPRASIRLLRAEARPTLGQAPNESVWCLPRWT